MGLMFDFGQWIVGGRQQHLCFACRVSWVRFARHGWWALLTVGLGFAVMGMGLLNRCLRLGFEWVVGCGSWLWWSMVVGCLGGFRCWYGGFWVLFWWLFGWFGLVDV